MNADANGGQVLLNTLPQIQLVNFKLDDRRYALPLPAVERFLMRDWAVINRAPH